MVKGWIFNNNEAKIASRVFRDILWFDKLLFESNEEQFSF